MSDRKRDRSEMRRSQMHKARRGRNLALLAVLIGLVVLFYFITIARMGS